MRTTIQVQIRLIANNYDELKAAIEELQRAHGDKVQSLEMPNRPGRHGEWIAYGTLLIIVP